MHAVELPLPAVGESPIYRLYLLLARIIHTESVCFFALAGFYHPKN